MSATRSHFYFGGSDSSNSDDENPLPYPKPLTRSSFLTPDFSPTAFLSSLHNRHQTLEDLRQELRTRSQELNKELLDLVNDNYQDFLRLGTSLKGGEEKVEEVRLGLLGFQREVATLKVRVEERRKEVESLIETKREVAKETRMGQGLLEVDARLEELEQSLHVGLAGHTINGGPEIEFSSSEDESDDEEVMGNAVSTARLRKRAQQFVYVKRLIMKLGPEHPFLVRQEDRVARIRQTLLLDLQSALVVARRQDADRKIKVLAIYRDMGESAEALQALRDDK